MPRYYFYLCDHETIVDADGTDLANDDAARDHALQVARELTFQSSGMLQRNWEEWVMSVRDGDGVEVFSLPLVDHNVADANSRAARQRRG